MDLMRAADFHIQSTNASCTLGSELKQRGSLPICQEKIAGSSAYALPVMLLVRETIART